ncbi:hypothetical protein [Pseudoalteromonas sp.]|uniref:hypothetical protein n=1 Tax=Pseudoalteromonas sp. TaxID=53249 RepID=UPI0026016409|nr:hypothetical protein [Pseudoalteromonas sp.]MCP4586903.1 hypothetical protein [Pseudoalteromonas sp.]
MSARFQRLKQIEQSLILLQGSFLNLHVQQGANSIVLNTNQQEHLQLLIIKMLEEEANQQAFELATLPALFQRSLT